MIPEGIILFEEWFTSLAVPINTASNPIPVVKTSRGVEKGNVIPAVYIEARDSWWRKKYRYWKDIAEKVLFLNMLMGLARVKPLAIIGLYIKMESIVSEDFRGSVVATAEIHGAGVADPAYISGQFTF